MSSYFRSLYQAYSKISPAALALVLSQPNNMRVFQAALFAAFACAVSASGFIGLAYGQGGAVEAVQGLVSRVLGEEYVSSFSYETEAPGPDGLDEFWVLSGDGDQMPVLGGTTATAMGSAFNHWLKYSANSSVTWGIDGSGDNLQVPLPVPPVAAGGSGRFK